MYTIILVEDETLIRQELLITIDWESIGCRIIGDAADGVSGEQMIKALQPDIVLTDIRLPGQSGLQMLNKTKPRASVIFTGYGEFALAQEAIRLGVHDYLLKPLEHDQLLSCVSTLCKKLDAQSLKDRVSNPLRGAGQPAIVKMAMDFIDENYHRDISIYSVGSHLQLSESHISHLFKEHSGYTVLGYLQNRRIREAMRLLRETSLQITEIYQRCGFLSGSYFSKLFKRYTGISPREYRKGSPTQ